MYRACRQAQPNAALPLLWHPRASCSPPPPPARLLHSPSPHCRPASALLLSLSPASSYGQHHTTLHVNESGAASRQWNSDHFFLGAGDLERDALAGDLVGGDLAGVDLAGVDLVGAGDLERDALPLPVAGAMTFCVPPATTLYQSAAGSSQHSAMARMGAAASRLSIEPVLRMRSGKKSCVLRS